MHLRCGNLPRNCEHLTAFAAYLDRLWAVNTFNVTYEAHFRLCVYRKIRKLLLVHPHHSEVNVLSFNREYTIDNYYSLCTYWFKEIIAVFSSLFRKVYLLFVYL